MIHPATELRLVNATIGYGVFANLDIPRGTITWARDGLDRSFTREQIRAMESPYPEIIHKYSFVTRDGNHCLCWDIGRYLNHSCRANCLAPGYDFEIAVRDIVKDEELTDDYGALNIDAEFECHCFAQDCRKKIRPGDLLDHAEEWDRQIAGAFALISSVAQPLWQFVHERDEIQRVLASGAPPTSCRTHYYPIDVAIADTRR